MESEYDSSEYGVYVPLAERIAKMESKTPDRFKREPVLREANHEKWKRRATKPREPRFATDARSNRLRAGRADASNKPEKSKRRAPAGAPNLRTARRAAYHEPAEAETIDRNFKARPMPRMNGSRVGPSRSASMVSQTTKQEPFSFDKRVPKKKPAPEPKPQMKRHHAAGALPVSMDKPGGLPERHTRTTTKAEPFAFATAARNEGKNAFIQEPTFTFGTTKHSDEEFMRKALDGHQPIISKAKGSTVPKTPTLSSKSRANKRAEYDEDQRQKREQEEEQRKADEEAKREIDKHEEDQYRQTLVHKPNPIRTNFKPVPERKEIPTTLPITPNYAGPRTRSRKPRINKTTN